jgi:3-deoxy-D-manno-octulosonic-acid transferase
MSGPNPDLSSKCRSRHRVRRFFFQCFNFLAFLRMLLLDRRPLVAWFAEMCERLGFTPFRAERSIWIHGEGMGEFNAATQLVHELRQKCPDSSFIFTCSRSVTRDWLVGKYPADACLPQPWDMPFGVGRFFARLRPRLIILLEYHDGFCPGALLKARDEGIPVVVVNGRTLPASKPRRYRVADRLGLVTAMAPFIGRFCTQDGATCTRLIEAGADPASVIETGNLKYDCTPPGPADLAAFRKETGLPETKPVVTIGCIHPEEARPIVTAIHKLWSARPELRFVLAPLGPLQAGRLGRRLRSARMGYVRRSRRQALKTEPVLLLDSFNELGYAYGIAQAVVLGGSFAAGCGGHSVAEAAAQAKPIVFGPFMDSQRRMAAAFLTHEAAVQCDAQELPAALERLLSDVGTRERLGEQARELVAQHAGATNRTLEVIEPLLRHSAMGMAGPRTLLKRALAALAGSNLGQALLALRARRIGSLEELRDRLGEPETILCLGNGPSSEDAELDGIKHDCLFRVNWRWRERGRFNRPDVVFTGDRTTLSRCGRCLFGFRTLAEELSILGRHFFSLRRRVSYFTTERLPLWVNDAWSARPTNGAVMIAVAAALQPKRLVIAGIDLFQHAEGAYPGGAGVNRYASVHERAVELGIIRRALAEFRGEVVLIGPPLREALAEKRAA